MPVISDEFWQAIEGSSLATFVKDAVWAYPALETVHIIGLGLLFGAIIAFDLRVLGLNKSLPLSQLGRHLLPWVWTGFALNATSGVLLFASDALEFSSNPALWAKLSLIVLAGVNALYFQARIMPSATAWEANTATPTRARLSAMLSMTLWLAIIVAGRMIAYVK